MEQGKSFESKGLLQTTELYKYILETNVYPRELEPLKELRALTASHPSELPKWSLWDVPSCTLGSWSSFIAILVFKGVFTAQACTSYVLCNKLVYQTHHKNPCVVLCRTPYQTPPKVCIVMQLLFLELTPSKIHQGQKIVAIDMSRESYEIGRPVIQKAGVEHKIDFIESQALPALDELLKNADNEGSFDYAFVDADKLNYLNYHERIIKLLKVNGIVVYDNTLWLGSVAKPENLVPEKYKEGRSETIKFNKALAADPRVEICMAPLGDGITICKRLY